MLKKQAVLRSVRDVARSADPAIGKFDDAVILGRFGETPEDLAGVAIVE